MLTTWENSPLLIREERNHCEIHQIVPRSYLAFPTKAFSASDWPGGRETASTGFSNNTIQPRKGGNWKAFAISHPRGTSTQKIWVYHLYHFLTPLLKSCSQQFPFTQYITSSHREKKKKQRQVTLMAKTIVWRKEQASEQIWVWKEW